MPSEKDRRLAVWLVRQQYLSMEQAEQLVQLADEAAAKGQKAPLLALAIKQGWLTRAQGLEIQQTLAPRPAATGTAPADPAPLPRKVVRTPPAAKPVPAKPAAQAVPAASVPPAPAPLPPPREVAAAPTLNRACRECLAEIPAELAECRVCGAPQPRLLRLSCARCGHDADATATACPACGCHPRTGTPGSYAVRCKGCTQPLVPDDLLCGHCGRPASASRETRGAGVAGHALLGLVLVLGLSGYGLGVQGGAKPESTAQERPADDGGLFPGVVARPIEGFDASRDGPEQADLLGHAMERAQAGDWQAVARLLEGSLQVLNGQLLPLYVRALVALERPADAAAIQKAHAEVPGLQPLVAEAAFGEARRLFKAGKAPEALALMARALPGLGDDPDALLWTGLMALKAGKAEEAAGFLQQCLALSPGRAEAHLLLHLAFKTAKPGEAAAHLKAFASAGGDARRFAPLLEAEGK